MKEPLRFSVVREGDVFTSVYCVITEDEVKRYKDIFPGRTYGKEVPPFLMVMKSPLPILERYELIPGTVHISQEVKFFKSVQVGEKLCINAKVVRKVERRGVKFVEFEVEMEGETGALILRTKFAFLLPE